ncbi:MAG: tetratricopeptide repeat protein [Planctomycetaceae bacterium]
MAVAAGLALAVGGATWWAVEHGRPERRFARGLAALERGDLTAARTEADALRETEGFKAQGHLLSGTIALRSGEPAEAIEILAPARHEPRTRARAWALTGEAQYHLHRLDEARRSLKAAVHFDAERVDAHRLLAALYYDIGAMDPALHHLDRTAELDRDDPRPHRLRGLILKDYERYDEAVAAYRESLRRNADWQSADEVRMELAECLIELHRPQEALAVLADCARGADVWALQAECRYALGRKDEARRLVARTLDRDPSHRRALLLQATMDLDGGRTAQAAERLERAVVLHPKDPVVRSRLSQAYRLLGETDKADEQLAAMQRLRDLRGRFTALHEQALRDETNADLRYELGVVALQLDRPMLARTWFEAALSLSPEHQEARQALEAMTRSR